ncbi:MAG: hydrogenase maturation protease [Desulfuromonadales bacterium]
MRETTGQPSPLLAFPRWGEELRSLPQRGRVGEGVSETVIIGMGNPLLSDDGVGIAVAHAVAEHLKHRMDLTVTELHTGGIRLMEAMAGFKRAVVVDAMLSGATPGTIRRFDPHVFVTTKNTFSSHDTDFATACDLGRMAGVHLPEKVSFWGIEAREFDLFGERFTDEVSAAIPGTVNLIVAEIIAWEAAV